MVRRRPIVIGVRVTDEQARMLDAIAARFEISRPELVHTAIAALIDGHISEQEEAS